MMALRGINQTCRNGGLKLNQLDRFRAKAGLPCRIAKVRWAQIAVIARRHGERVKSTRKLPFKIGLLRGGKRDEADFL